MRTFRTVLVVLCLALVTSTAAVAVPAEATLDAGGRSFTSWVISAFDWVLASFSSDEVAASVESEPSDGTDDTKPQPPEGDEPPPDEIGGALEPHG